MVAPASSRPARQTPWQRADAAFISLPDSPTGLAPDLQALLRRGWMEALAWRLVRRRIQAAMGIESRNNGTRRVELGARAAMSDAGHRTIRRSPATSLPRMKLSAS